MLKIIYDEFVYDQKVVIKSGEVKITKGVTFIKGENGSGKTTFFNGLYRGGNNCIKIILEDVVISDEEVEEYRNNYISYVSQKNMLFNNLCVNENINLIVNNKNEQKFQTLVSALNFENVIKRDPKVKKLSGGEKQKLKILCALLSDKPILILDEPFNNLDTQSIEYLNNYMQTENRYLLITSHIPIEVKHNQLRVEDSHLICDVSYDSKDKVEFKQKENLYLNKKKLNNLTTINKNLRLSLYAINIVVVIIFLFAFIITMSNYMMATRDRSNYIFNDTSMIISPPIYNSYFRTFGDEKWLTTTPTLFSDKEIASLESLPYVTYVSPIKNRERFVGGISYANKYILDNELYTFTTSLYPKRIIEKIPPSYNIINTGQVIGVEAGEYPEDGTNEVAVDNIMAEYIIKNSQYKSYDQLIGKTFDVPVIIKDEGKKTTIPLVISGVLLVDSNDDTQGTIISSFDISNNNYTFQVYSNLQSTNDVYEDIKGKYNIAQISTTNLSVSDIPNPAYDTLYIEVDEKASIEKLTKEIEQYDKYIDIDNNYTNTRTVNFKYLTIILFKNMLIVGLILSLFILCLTLIFKLYLKEIVKVKRLLTFYGYKPKESLKYLKAEIKTYLLNVVIINILISIIVLYSQEYFQYTSELLVTNILIIVINIVLIYATLYRSARGAESD